MAARLQGSRVVDGLERRRSCRSSSERRWSCQNFPTAADVGKHVLHGRERAPSHPSFSNSRGIIYELCLVKTNQLVKTKASMLSINNSFVTTKRLSLFFPNFTNHRILSNLGFSPFKLFGP